MRDMADTCATISVASCYIFRSRLQGAVHAEAGLSHDKTRGARLAHRAAGDGAARLAGPALDASHRLGTARESHADLARAAHGLRRGLADRAERPAEGIARGGLRRPRRGRGLRAHAARQRTVGAGDAAPSVRGEVERAIASPVIARSAATKQSRLAPRKDSGLLRFARNDEVGYAAATVWLAPSACTILTRLPAGVSGPATRQMVSSIRTVPLPSMIGFSSVKTRPTSASARLLRKGLLALAVLLLFARRRQTGTAMAANTANINSCVCHDGCNTNDTSPTSSAASPSQNRKTPGAINSSAIRMNPKISQFQVPSVVNISAMTRPLASRHLSPAGRATVFLVKRF